MPGWRDRVRGDPLNWLLEPDERQPGVRCFTLRDIAGRPGHDATVTEAQAAIMFQVLKAAYGD